MRLSYYKKPFILVGIYYVFMILISMTNLGLFADPLTTFLPGDGRTQFYIIFLLYPISAIVGSHLIGYILSPLFLLVHTKFFGRSLQYGIQETKNPIRFKKTFQAFFPTLLAMNLAMFLASNASIVENVLYHYLWDFPWVIGEINIAAFVVLLNLTLGIGMGLFSSAWLLSDAGITFSNKKKIVNTDFPHEIRSIGRVYLAFLKGYAGIGVFIAYAQLMYTFIYNSLQQWGDVAVPGIIAYMVVFISIPILLSCGSTLPIIIFDLTKRRRINFVRKIAKKFGISDTINISIEISNK